MSVTLTFDHFSSNLIGPVAWDNSIFDKLKHLECLKQYVWQIAEVKEYLNGMMLWEFFNYAPQVSETMITKDGDTFEMFEVPAANKDVCI